MTGLLTPIQGARNSCAAREGWLQGLRGRREAVANRR
jgi:hypothetical protein